MESHREKPADFDNLEGPEVADEAIKNKDDAFKKKAFWPVKLQIKGDKDQTIESLLKFQTGDAMNLEQIIMAQQDEPG